MMREKLHTHTATGFFLVCFMLRDLDLRFSCLIGTTTTHDFLSLFPLSIGFYLIVKEKTPKIFVPIWPIIMHGGKKG